MMYLLSIRSQNGDLWLEQTILNALSWRQLILFFNFLEWNIHIKLKFYESFYYHSALIKWHVINKVAKYVYFFTYFVKYRRNMLVKSKFEPIWVQGVFQLNLILRRLHQNKFFLGVLGLKGRFFQGWILCDCC